MVIVARLADHIEDIPDNDYEPLDLADRLFNQFKRSAPELWHRLDYSGMEARQAGDWLWKFLGKHARSGQSLKNFDDLPVL